MKYSTIEQMNSHQRVEAAASLVALGTKSRFIRRLKKVGLDPDDYSRGYATSLLVYTASRHQSVGGYVVNRIQSQRRYAKQTPGDKLARPLGERLSEWRARPLQLLEKLRKDQPGQLVSFEIECKLAPTEGVRRHSWPLLAGGVHAEHDGLEIPVVCRWDDLRPLYRVCATLRAFGATITRQFGGHVHLDVRDLYTGGSVPKSLKARIDRIVVPGVERVLRWCVPASRVGNSYCQLTGADWRYCDRYRAVNVCSLGEHRTIEIRLGAASLNPDKWRLWAQACLFFLRGNIDKAQMATLAEIDTARRAADWIMLSYMEPALKWWLLGRLRKFHPSALPELPPQNDAPGADS